MSPFGPENPGLRTGYRERNMTHAEKEHLHEMHEPRWFRRLAVTLELTVGLVYTPSLFLRAFLRRGSIIRNRARRRRIWSEIVLLAAVWSGIVAATAWWGAWKFFLVMFVAPAFLA